MDVWEMDGKKLSREELLRLPDPKKMPRHLALIMDGNGRWAEKRGLSRAAGHRQGMEALKRVVRATADLGIPVLTIYAFSTENWKRPLAEVGILMDLLVEYLARQLRELNEEGVRIRAIGDLSALPEKARRAIQDAEAKTAANQRLILNVALNYGGRAELLAAAKSLAADAAAGKLAPEAIREADIAERLYTAGQPDPDILIRSSGEQRLSNFLLWQLAYTELYFTETYWPDFDLAEIVQAVLAFQQRSRRYGGI